VSEPVEQFTMTSLLSIVDLPLAPSTYDNDINTIIFLIIIVYRLKVYDMRFLMIRCSQWVAELH
jgi:hypothetical protein